MANILLLEFLLSHSKVSDANIGIIANLCIMGKLDCVGKSIEEDKYDKCKESVFYLISANRSREVLSQCTFLSSGTSALFKCFTFENEKYHQNVFIFPLLS